MIDFKPSARLGLLNEENFTTNPTSRGWAINSVGYTVSYGTSGLKLTQGVNSNSTATLELNTKLLQAMCFIIECNNDNFYVSSAPNIIIKFNDIEVFNYSTDAYDRGTIQKGKAYCTFFKKTNKEWVIATCSSTAYGLGDPKITTKSININCVNNLKIIITSITTPSGASYRDIILSNLKWV